MPTPIPTTYQLYLDPLQGFTPGGTTWADQSVNENNFTFTNTSYTYESVIGSFLFPATAGAVANEDIQPGSLPIGTSAITIICWVKINERDPLNESYSLFNIGRAPTGAVTIPQIISLGIQAGDFGSGPYRSIAVFNRAGTRYSTNPIDAVPYDTWTMISYTKPASGTVASQILYKNATACSTYSTANGTRVVNTSLSGGSGSDPRVAINRYTTEIFTNTAFSLGEMWIYNQELTAGDISNFYDVTQPRYYPPTPVDGSDGRSFGQGFNG